MTGKRFLQSRDLVACSALVSMVNDIRNSYEYGGTKTQSRTIMNANGIKILTKTGELLPAHATRRW